MSNEPIAAGADFSVARRRRRYYLTLPLRVLIRKCRGRGLPSIRRLTQTMTQNINSKGCYFLIDGEPHVQDQVELEVFMQPQKESISSCRAVCRGRVVRVEKKQEGGKVGVACIIDSYHLTAAPVA
jgi:PilZ domain